MVIATSWPAYRTVVYDVIVNGPAQLSAAIGGAAGLSVDEVDLVGRLHAVDLTIGRLINLGTGRNDATALTPPEDNVQGQPPRRTPIADDPAFGAARVVFLSSTVAAFSIVRLTAGVLLALAPLFAGLLLFGLTRGLVIGWARALVFVLLASVAVTILLGVQLTLLEPWLAQVLGLRNSKMVTAAAPVELLIICLGFALALAGSLAVFLRLAFAASLPFGRGLMAAAEPLRFSPEPILASSYQPRADSTAPRAQAVAGALVASVRREQAFHQHAVSSVSAGASPERSGTSPSVDEFAIPALGQAMRRTKPRKSLGAALRDHRS